MENGMERELSLVKLFWKLIFGWRRLIVMGVVFAILVSGLQYIRGLAAWKQQPGDDTEEIIVLSQEDQQKVNNILALQKRLSETSSYLQESILMNLDAYNENALVLRYYVDSDYTFNFMEDNISDYTDDVVTAYCSYVTSGMIADAVAEALNLRDETNYISELITAADEGTGDKTKTIFEVVVVHPDPEILAQIKPVITDLIEEQSKKISDEIGPHTLKLLTDTITVRVDKNLILAQKEKNDAIYNYHTQLSALEAGLSEEQIAVLEKEREEDGELDETEEIGMVRPSFQMKYAILGFLAGVFLACIWLCLEVLLATKVQDSEELSEIYGLRILGELKEENHKKKILYFLDSLLINLRDRNVKQLSQEQRIHITSSNLEISCNQMGIKQLYITGSEFENQQYKSLEKIWKSLSESGIQVYKGTNIVYDASSLKIMTEIGNVIFVEQVGVSLYRELEKEIKVAKENGIQIIGSVIIS